MKARVFLMLALAITAPLATASGATFGQHGMVLFGGPGGLYAAHLPMFHPPHDYQVLLQIRLADMAQDAALRRRLGASPALWTLAPEKFELDRFAPGAPAPLRHFKGDLVLGHFEQGGQIQYAAARIVVERVLSLHRLAPGPAVSRSARYVQVGSGARRFLVKQLDSRPDFDHVVSIVVPPHTTSASVTVVKQGLAETAAVALRRALPGAYVAGTVYYSAADLK